MKSTGIVRRIDDLGRVVIPREIRRSIHLREGDPLEIFTTSNGGILLKKYIVSESQVEACSILEMLESGDFKRMEPKKQRNLIELLKEYNQAIYMDDEEV